MKTVEIITHTTNELGNSIETIEDVACKGCNGTGRLVKKQHYYFMKCCMPKDILIIIRIY